MGVTEVENHPYGTKESFGVEKSAFADYGFAKKTLFCLVGFLGFFFCQGILQMKGLNQP